ncbi:MAG: cation diffusion facilitator family transporter [Geminicoccaceae bacterium]
MTGGENGPERARPHDHGSSGHSNAAGNERAVGIAAVLTGTFMLVEFFGGIASGSLTLIADAGHMLTDFVSLLLAWFAFRLAQRPADWRRTYGYDRFSVLAAFVNGLSLFVIAIWICVEAWERLSQPVHILGGLMLWVALAGLAVNILSFWVLSRQGGENLNIRAALLHVAGDLLGSAGALVAAVVIILTGWTPIDPLLSVLVSLLILRAAWNVVSESGHILLEGVPRGFDRDKVASVIVERVPGVAAVSHIHAWSITQERPMVTMEVAIEPGASAAAAKQAVKTLLRETFDVVHATIEIERLPADRAPEAIPKPRIPEVPHAAD